MDEDRNLLEQYERGSEEAFTKLVQRHQKGLYRVAYRMLGNQEDSLDLVQKTFVRLFTRRGTFRGEARLSTWVYRILVNLCKNQLRDLARRRVVSGEDVSQAPAGSRTALESLISRSAREELQGAIQALPEKQRMTVILRVYGELPFEKVAEALECSIGTAKANFHHGLMHLRRRLKEGKND